MLNRYEEEWNEYISPLATVVARKYKEKWIEEGPPKWRQVDMSPPFFDYQNQAAEELGVKLEDLGHFSQIDFLDEVNEELE